MSKKVSETRDTIRTQAVSYLQQQKTHSRHSKSNSNDLKYQIWCLYMAPLATSQRLTAIQGSPISVPVRPHNFRTDWLWSIFYVRPSLSVDLRSKAVILWGKVFALTLVDRLGGPSLPRNSLSKVTGSTWPWRCWLGRISPKHSIFTLKCQVFNSFLLKAEYIAGNRTSLSRREKATAKSLREKSTTKSTYVSAIIHSWGSVAESTA